MGSGGASAKAGVSEESQGTMERQAGKVSVCCWCLCNITTSKPTEGTCLVMVEPETST